MVHSKEKTAGDVPFMARPHVGTAFTIAAGLSFLLTAMLLPLVGKAGVKTSYYPINFTAFLAVLLITIVCSALAIRSKLERRRMDASPRPVFSMAICGASLFLLVALLLGLLKI